jgi:hypothetical protein
MLNNTHRQPHQQIAAQLDQSSGIHCGLRAGLVVEEVESALSSAHRLIPSNRLSIGPVRCSLNQRHTLLTALKSLDLMAIFLALGCALLLLFVSGLELAQFFDNYAGLAVENARTRRAFQFSSRTTRWK